MFNFSREEVRIRLGRWLRLWLRLRLRLRGFGSRGFSRLFLRPVPQQ
jgi:hypothetical protein